MYPIALNLSSIPVLLAGRGELRDKRLALLQKAGATQIVTAEIPTAEQIASVRIVMAAGLSYEESKAISDAARAAGKLVNIEDINDLCDFYFTANVQRGDLVIAVSTSGASPVLARRIKEYLENRFGPEWEQYVAEIKSARALWKAEGKGFKELIAAGEAFIKDRGWLGCSRNCHSEHSVAKSKDRFSVQEKRSLGVDRDDKEAVA
ncbi:MAG: NAD(P)-dependent oxidoreductase [Rickettsiales bacterium]|nr:NAD(P)-dependent oxidoreductase [Rickettsiales bacterium]